MEKEENGAATAQIWRLAVIISWSDKFRDERMVILRE